jgi:hypothetical protein
MKLFIITLLLAFLGAILLIVGCAPQEPPPANKQYIESLVDQVIALRQVEHPGENCTRKATHIAGQFALIEVACSNDNNVEVGFHARDRKVFRQKVWSHVGSSGAVTEDQLILELGAPQMEAWMLIDMREHP